MSQPLKLQIIVGSVREGRRSLPVAQWVHGGGMQRKDIDCELVDLAEWPMPAFALASPPAMGRYDDLLQQRWAAKINQADGYVFVAPEYNHSISAVLKNALDYLYAEWNRKPAAFVSFGNTGGARAVEHLRGIAVELRMAPLGEAVYIFDVGRKLSDGHFAGDASDDRQRTRMFDSLSWWGKALRSARDRDGFRCNNPEKAS